MDGGPVRRVPETLRPYVSSLGLYDVVYDAPGSHRGLPSTTLTLILALDTPLEVSWAGDPGSRRVGWATVAGLHTTPALIHHSGWQRGLQLALTPAGAQALLGLSASALAGEIVDLAEAGPHLAGLPEALHAEATGRSRERLDSPAVVCRWLVGALSQHRGAAPRKEVGWALDALHRGLSVQRVAEEVGYSRRRLSTLVSQACGVTPKEYQRIARFQSSRARLQRQVALGRGPDLAGLAARCGYADQSHLTREWTRLAGCPPTTWLREEFPFVQDPAGPEAGG